MFAASLQRLAFMIMMLRYTTADYTCLCNYAVEVPVYTSPDVTSSPIGYMYEFDCKATTDTVASSSGWAAIQFEHKIGYIETGSNSMEQTCQGQIPDDDKLTTQSSTTQFSTTLTPSTLTSTSPLSTGPTTSTTTSTTPKTTPPTPATTTHSTTTVTTSSSLTQHSTTAQHSMQTTMTSVPIVSRDPTTSYPTSRHTNRPPTSSPITTPALTTSSNTNTPTTSDWLIHFNSHGPMNYSTGSTQGISGNKMTTTADWLIHIGHQDIKTTTPNWQIPLGNHGNTTTSSSGTNWHFSHGDLSVCPSSLVQAHSNTSDISQHGHYCYEIHRPYGSWFDAHTDCVRRIGGHLVEPHTADQVSYLNRFLHHAHFARPVWIGLHDLSQEEEFHWDSGARVTYENWYPGRVDNHAPHDVEDCVMMRSNGEWDDRKCERDHIDDPEYQPHSWVCQYPVTQHTNWIPIG